MMMMRLATNRVGGGLKRMLSSSVMMDKSRQRGKPLSQLKEVPEHLERMDETSLSINLFSKFSSDLEEMRKSDVVIVGSGLSALSCVYQILKSVTRKADPPVKISIFEKEDGIAGGSGTTGGLLPYTIVRKPADKVLKECGMGDLYEDKGKYVVIESSTLRSCMLAKITHLAAAHKGVVLKFFPGVDVVDVLLEEPYSYSPVKGVAAAITSSLHRGGHGSNDQPPNIDVPIFMDCNVLISASGFHNINDGLRKALVRMNNYGFTGASISDEPFLHGGVDFNLAEDSMIHYTREVSTGFIVTGSEVSWLDYLSHPPSLAGGGRLLSGLKAGKIATRAIQDAREKKSANSAGYVTSGHFLHDDVVGIDGTLQP
jgi:ribulose 1,5-bisphosphate synthetase/thiazole synthase